MSIPSKEISGTSSITPELIQQFASEFDATPGSHVRMNAIVKNGIQGVATNRASLIDMQFTFSHEIETGPATNQKQSGRCWLFAGLNALRVDVIKTNHLKPFELSQCYQMFWDKFEKANYFLERVLDTLDEATDSRLLQWLLQSPLQDGGQWDMFVNLVEKYGVVPQYVMPETYHSSKSLQMNRLLTQKLRNYAAQIRRKYQSGTAIPELRTEKQTILKEFYRLLCYFLGTPPTQFDFEYRDKDDAFHRDTNVKPTEFLSRYSTTNLRDYVSVIHAPTADKPFGRTYTVQYLGNVEGGSNVLYLNVDMPTFKSLAMAQIVDHEPVWFGCDVGKMSEREQGVLDTDVYDYDGALDATFTMSKADRLDYGESQMTHAMMLSGVHVVDGQATRWKVENSWGKDVGQDGFFVMSDAWFEAYMYQIVVHRKHLPQHLLGVLGQAPIVLKPWDPMGSLA